MDFIIDAIVEWLKGLLVDGIMGNLDGLFDNVNQSVGEIATQVGTTPADWNAGVFSMIRQISETAILPIAGVILTFVMTYELIQMLIERNNLHEVDTWMFFKWVFKTFVAVMILTNTFNIVLAVFDVSQHVIQQSAGIIQNGTEITPDVLDSLRTELEAMELGPLFGLWLQSFLIQLTMIALNIVIFVIVYESICYMDTDVYIQGSFDAIWTECRQNIMLYDINHGLNTRDYVLLCDEIESYCGQRKLITHYGGEFFAASAENAKAFVDICEQVYYEMLQKNFITTKGDEFILSLAANEMRESIKNLFTWASTYQNASFQQRQAILNQFIKEVRVGRDYDIEIILNVPLEEFEEFKSHSLSVRTPSGRKMDLKQAPVRGLGTPNGGIVVFDKTSGEAMNIMPKSSAHVTLRCQDE